MSETTKVVLKKPFKSKEASGDNVIKVDLSKPPTKEEETTEETKETKVEAVKEEENQSTVEVVEEPKTEDPFAGMEEISDSEPEALTPEEKEENIPSAQSEESALPNEIEKLISFMDETGGGLEDYVRLNADYSNVNSEVLLKEYYKKSKPHLDAEEISFLMEDKFSYDEDLDDERDIRMKKLAQKEEVAKAHKYLDDMKGKYYEEVKSRPSVNKDHQKAMDFFNRHSEEQANASKQHQAFKDSTNKMFSNEFEGFDFNVGEKKFRYGIKDPSAVAEKQSDISNFIGKFLDKGGNVKDVRGYHKAMYAANNSDTIAQHFYEQGKADAIKDVAASSRNISNEARSSGDNGSFINGMRVKSISGVSSSKLKIKSRK